MIEESVPAAPEQDGPLALVIGCGDMGMGSARALGRRHPLLLVDIDDLRLDRCVADLRGEGFTVAGRACDITDRSQVAALAEYLAAGPGVKVLDHVAAIGNDGGGWRKVIDVDLVGAQLIADAVGPHMVPGGVAIFVSSTGALRCPRDRRLDALLDEPLRPDLCDRLVDLTGRELNFLEAYFMSKRGINRMAERLAVAWGERGVRVLSVSPGLIDSTMGRTGGALLPVFDATGVPRLGTRDEKARIEVPLQRQGAVAEVIAAIDFLASDAASFINGIDVAVDGGSSAYWRLSGNVSQSLDSELLAPEPPTGP